MTTKMISRRRISMLMGVGLLVGMWALAGCQREPTETLEEFLDETRSGEKARQLLKRYFPDSPVKPDGLELASELRILAPPGWFDRYQEVDPKHSRLIGNASLFVGEGDGEYRSIDRAEANRLARDGEQIYAYRRAPGIVRFERDYRIRVVLENFTPEELTFMGINAERSREFDLVFGPRTMLPVLLDHQEVAPFSADALTRSGSPLRFISEVLAHRPADLDLEFSLPYAWRPVGIGFNERMASHTPEQWSDALEFERNERYWDRVWLRRNPFILLGLAVMYRDELSTEELARSRQSTRELIEEVQSLAEPDNPVANKASAFRELRHRFAKPELDDGSHRNYDIHDADFTTKETSKYEFQRYRHMVTNQVHESHFHTHTEIAEAADYLKRLLVFGAHLTEGAGTPLDVENEDWVYDIGSSGDPYVGMRVHSTYDYAVPSARAPLELDVFILPEGRPERSRRTAEFLVDYLLIPEVAASMTAFNLKATFVREAIAFLPVSLTNSSVYSLPSLEDVVYLPIIRDSADQLREHWESVLEFEQQVRSIDGNFGASPHATGPWQETKL